MLWKKESNKPDSLYVDMFALCKKYLEDEFRGIHSKYTHPMPQKDDAIALEHRNKGNSLFRSSQWFWAMELYNESLRFAVPGSQHISLAYANRSYSFLKLNMYEKCLKDIKLAKKAGYSKDLMHKLDSREAECLQRLAEGAESYKIGGKLSYDADENFPCMANVLEVQMDTDGNTIVVAKEDIDVDQTIVVEDLMFPYALKRYGLMCNICTKRCENFEPCEKCAVAMFCPDCKGHFLHKYECGLSFCGQGSYNYEVMTEVRRILLTVKMFATVDELMEFINQIQGEPKKMPASLIDDKAKYQMFFKRPPTDHNRDGLPHYHALMVYPVYHTVLRVPEIKAMFRSQKHLRFLMHLIAHQGLIVPSTAVFLAAMQPVPFMPDDEKPEVFANGYHFSHHYFRHSCYPNALSILGNGQNTMVTVRPIKKGEQLFEAKVPFIYPKQQRDKELGENCVCSRCQGVVANVAERQQLSSEPVYQNLGSKVLKFRLAAFSNHNAFEKNKEAIGDCVLLLRKYGHIQWCDEINSVLSHNQGLLYNRLVGTLN